MKVKPILIIAPLLVIAGIGASIYSFIASATPYVSAKEAASMPETPVHIAGDILHNTASLNPATSEFRFSIRDAEGTILEVINPKGKPGNFDGAPTASVAGVYRDGVFHATEIKTQCPSKYEVEKQ
jgi:cytochrome c-type biogenesis protein CcmE